MVQRRAAGYAVNRYRNTSSATEMLEDLGWETLESRRAKVQMTMLYKILNNLLDIPASTYLTSASSRTRSNHTKKMIQYATKANTLKYSFFPTHDPSIEFFKMIAEAPDVVSFQRELSTIFSKFCRGLDCK